MADAISHRRHLASLAQQRCGRSRVRQTNERTDKLQDIATGASKASLTYLLSAEASHF